MFGLEWTIVGIRVCLSVGETERTERETEGNRERDREKRRESQREKEREQWREANLIKLLQGFHNMICTLQQKNRKMFHPSD